MINFPPATADGQIFQFNNLTWIWKSSTTRWESLKTTNTFPIPVLFGGTGANTASAARQNLKISSSTGLTFTTIADTASGFNTSSFLNPNIFTIARILPGIRIINCTDTASILSGGPHLNTNVAFGSTNMDFPSSFGFNIRSTTITNAVTINSNSVQSSLDWGKTLIFSGRFRINPSTSLLNSARSLRITFGNNSSDEGGIPFSDGRKGVGLRWEIPGNGTNNNIELIFQNGPLSSFSAISTSFIVPVAAGLIDYSITSRNGNIALFINNQLAASSVNGPTGIVNALDSQFRITTQTNAASVPATNTLRIAPINVYHE